MGLIFKFQDMTTVPLTIIWSNPNIILTLSINRSNAYKCRFVIIKPTTLTP